MSSFSSSLNECSSDSCGSLCSCVLENEHVFNTPKRNRRVSLSDDIGVVVFDVSDDERIDKKLRFLEVNSHLRAENVRMNKLKSKYGSKWVVYEEVEEIYHTLEVNRNSVEREEMLERYLISVSFKRACDAINNSIIFKAMRYFGSSHQKIDYPLIF